MGAQPTQNALGTAHIDGTDNYYVEKLLSLMKSSDVSVRVGAINELAELAENHGMSVDEFMKYQEAKQLERLRSKHHVAFSIPDGVYKRAMRKPESLTAEERDLILSRGDIYGKAIVDAKLLLTQAERYEIIGWPAPAVAEARITAATVGTDQPMGTVAEVMAKAERDGYDSLHPAVYELAANSFHHGSPDGPNGLSSRYCASGGEMLIPGYNEAINLAIIAEGFTSQLVYGLIAQYTLTMSNKMMRELKNEMGGQDDDLPDIMEMIQWAGEEMEKLTAEAGEGPIDEDKLMEELMSKFLQFAV